MFQANRTTTAKALGRVYSCMLKRQPGGQRPVYLEESESQRSKRQQIMLRLLGHCKDLLLILRENPIIGEFEHRRDII